MSLSKRVFRMLNRSNKENKFRLPPEHSARCNMNDCDWSGQLGDCDVEMDSERWDSPAYEILVCPKCGETDIDFL